MQYEEKIRQFSLTLHYYSPVAYDYARSKFDTYLPHRKILYQWHRSIERKQGFTSEGFVAINMSSETARKKKQIMCSLEIYEMAIYFNSVHSGNEIYC